MPRQRVVEGFLDELEKDAVWMLPAAKAALPALKAAVPSAAAIGKGIVSGAKFAPFSYVLDEATRGPSVDTRTSKDKMKRLGQTAIGTAAAGGTWAAGASSYSRAAKALRAAAKTPGAGKVFRNIVRYGGKSRIPLLAAIAAGIYGSGKAYEYFAKPKQKKVTPIPQQAFRQ
jgi:hypothetical protein